MVGTVQKLTDEQAQVLKAIHEENLNAITAYKKASSWLRQIKEKLWCSIFEMYPDLESYECYFDFKNNQILIVKSKDE